MKAGEALLCFLTVTGLSLFAAQMMTSCTTKKGNNKSAKTLANLSEEERKKIDEQKQEIDLGRNMAGRLLALYGVYDDIKLRDYVNQVGVYVAGYSDFPERRYMFQVLDSDSINAFACPGGYILVTLGALRNAKNEAELAAVLGHEVAHVGNQHMFNTLKKMDKKTLADAEKGKKTKGSEVLNTRRRPKPEKDTATAFAARYLSSGSVALNILGAAKAGMNVILDKGLGAELEYEADMHGVRYAVRAGYDPQAMTDYLCRIEKKKHGGTCLKQKGKKGGKKTILDKTHPPVHKRVTKIQKVLKDMEADQIAGAKGAVRYKKFLKNMPKLKGKS